MIDCSKSHSRLWYTWAARGSVGIGVVVLLFPVALVLPLRWLAPPTTSFMLQYWAAAESPRYHWTTWDEMSSHLSVAVIAAEDQKFFNHHGFDVESIRESLVQAWDGTRVRGASTISQQVSKNLFLWPGRSLVRKGLEAYFTIFIELLWSKRRILEIYLNVVEFGDGIYGVATASDQFFDTVPALINAQQAALLAAVLPNPKVLKVDQPSAYVRERETWIRSQMGQLGESMLLEGLDAP